jgi:SapC.
MFYQKPAGLDKNKHAKLKYKSGQDYGFARNTNSIPLGGMEFFQACRDFPILFIKNQDNKFIPMAILSLHTGGHDIDDKWTGTYIPAFIRRYPFALTEDGIVIFDEEAPHLTLDEGEGELLFNDKQEATTTLNNVVNFLRAADQSFRKTEEFCTAVAEKDLFQPFNANVKYDGMNVSLSELYCIDEKKWHEALSAEEVNDWFRRGWIAWVHAHLHSFGSISELVKRKRNKPAEAATGAETPAK